MAMLLAFALLAQAGTFVPPVPRLAECTIAGSVPVASLDELPVKVRTALLTAFEGKLAEAGADFNPTDVIRDEALPQRRFVRAYGVGSDWAVWYEHGGRGYHLHVVGLRTSRGGDVSLDPFARYTGSSTAELCAASKAFFDGALTSYDM